MDKNYIEEELTNNIINLFYKVHHKLGFGFLEKVYKNALFIELSEAGFICETEKAINVLYNGKVIGQFFADIIVNGKVILELKACENLCAEHEYQLINYLKATNIEVGLLLNFGKKPTVRRKIYTNDRKFIS